MKLHLAAAEGRNTFTGYGAGYVSVNAQQHTAGILVLPEQPVLPWGLGGFAALAVPDFEAIAAHTPEIVLLGTGGRLQFPHPRLTQPLSGAGIGVEVMDTRAACRTYNILVAEGRKVAAALIIDAGS